MSFTEACWLEDSACKASCPSPSVFVLFTVNCVGKSRALYHPLGFSTISPSSVVVEQCFEVCFVMIGVSLRTNQGTSQSRTDLFKQSVGQIVRGPESCGFDYIITIHQFKR